MLIPSSSPNLSNIFISKTLERLQNYLDQTLIETQNPLSPLITAMRYSLLNGGKRLRALLVYATGEALGADLHLCDIAAAAVEMIHAFSLIHDDLPAMDNDILRRGIPTCHIAFDEATAILAGDALLTEAFDLLSYKIQNSKTAISMIQVLSRAIGKSGMVQGQTIDIQSENKILSLEELKQMHFLKTGCLITASIQMGYLTQEKSRPNIQTALKKYGESIGLAFQIKDDLLDATSSSEKLGKTAGIDLINHKSNFVALLGLSQANKIMESLIQEAHEALSPYPELAQSQLSFLANYVIEREH